MNHEIGYMIREQRRALDLSLEDVAKRCGVAKSTVLRWERGEISTFKIDTVSILCKTLNLTPEMFTGEQPIPQKTKKDLLIEKVMSMSEERANALLQFIETL